MYPVDLGDLERDIRMGLVSSTSELLHPPWTGARFRYLTEIPELSAAFEAPDARLNAWMSGRRRVRASGVVAALVAFAALLQTAGGAEGARPLLARLASAMPRYGAAGFEPTLLDGMWWTPLASQLVHDPELPLLHALVNLPLLAYGGYRVQRALGTSGYAFVAALSLGVGTIFVLFFGALPSVGSSLLGFGLWAAQIAIGFRWGQAIPRESRAFYGWGTWVVFAPLYALSLVGSDVTHTGHLGGVIGGFLAIALIEPESTAKVDRVQARRRRNLLFAALILLCSLLIGLVVPLFPGLMAFPEQVVEAPEQRARLTLPGRLADHPIAALEGQAWLPAPDSDEPFFISRSTDPSQDRQAFWASRLAGRAIACATPEVAPGWTGASWMILDNQSGEPSWRVVEEARVEGDEIVHVGYALRLGGPPDLGARERLMARGMMGVELLHDYDGLALPSPRTR